MHVAQKRPKSTTSALEKKSGGGNTSNLSHIAYVGRSVRKSFPPHGTFRGTVTSFDEAEALFQDTYEDGDQEEYNESEVNFINVQTEAGSIPSSVTRRRAAKGLSNDVDRTTVPPT